MVSIKQESFYHSLKGLLLLGGIFGVLPLQGLLNDDVLNLKFRWIYWRTFLNLYFMVGGAFIAATSLVQMVRVEFNIYELDGFVFYLNASVAYLIFLSLSQQIPALFKEWHLMEKRVFLSEKYRINLKSKIKTVTATFMILALIENVASNIRDISVTIKYKEENVEFGEYFYTIVAYKSVFSVTSYSLWKAIILKIFSCTCTFIWNYTDIFIMATSIAVASKFRQMNKRIEEYLKMEVKDLYLWRVVREDYSDVSNLTKLLNDKMSYLILLSFSCNVYVILQQCFNSLRDFTQLLEKIYFVYSFAFLIIRTASVCIYAAAINQEFQKPLKALFSVKSEIYNNEIKRLIRQIGSDDLCLTGRNFFKIKRSLILSIAGAVVTYELVIIQFAGEYLKLNG